MVALFLLQRIIIKNKLITRGCIFIWLIRADRRTYTSSMAQQKYLTRLASKTGQLVIIISIPITREGTIINSTKVLYN